MPWLTISTGSFFLSSTGLKSALKVRPAPPKRPRPTTPDEEPTGQPEAVFSDLSEAESETHEESPFGHEMLAGPEFEPQKLLEIVGSIEGRYRGLLEAVNGKMSAALA